MPESIAVGSNVVTFPFLETFIERYIAAWNGHDSSAITPLVTADVVWADPSQAEPLRGDGAVRGFMESSWRTFGDLQFMPAGAPCLARDATSVTWPWRMCGTHDGPIDPPGFAPTGKAIDIPGVDAWEFIDGRIAKYAAYFDMGLLSRQLGIMPPPGSRAEKAAVLMQRVQVTVAGRLPF